MANVKVVVHSEGVAAFLEQNPDVRALMMGVANDVAGTMQATADAQKGAGGTIDGYAEAGFAVEWQARGGKRPRVNIGTLADKETWLRAYFHTLRTNGVDHMRAALYKHTTRG